VRRKLGFIASCLLMVALFGCATTDCTYSVEVGSPDTDVFYTDSNGQVYTAKTDSNGNVAVPCGSEDTIEQVRISMEQSSV
jgi:hypothetical protein